jgi:hypothetical protein
LLQIALFSRDCLMSMSAALIAEVFREITAEFMSLGVAESFNSALNLHKTR